MSSAGYSSVFLRAYHVTEYWCRTDDDSWNWGGERANGMWLSRFHSVKHLSSWFLSCPPRLFRRGQLNNKKQGSQALSHIDSTLEECVQSLTCDAGMIPVDLEHALDFGVEVFILSEGCGGDSSLIAGVWGHSLRTGYLAALISLNQRAGQRMVWQSFVGGVLHDIGMLVFLTQQPQIFMTIVEMAQCRGWDLSVVERQMLGSTHAESGATFLARWGVDEVLLATVAFHDNPLKVPHSAFGPLTAVYAANLVEGGGMAQDGDGVIGREGEAYLTRLGLWDDLPLWQGWMRSIHQMTIQ
jgi:hypothetical protein